MLQQKLILILLITNFQNGFSYEYDYGEYVEDPKGYNLREAAKNGELNKVKSLLKLTYIDGKDVDGCTALAWAGEYFKSNE